MEQMEQSIGADSSRYLKPAKVLSKSNIIRYLDSWTAPCPKIIQNPVLKGTSVTDVFISSLAQEPSG